MTIESAITAAVRQSTQRLLEDAKALCNETYDLEGAYVAIELFKSYPGVLAGLCKKVDAHARDEIGGMLEKAQRKLARAEQLNGFLLNPSENTVDPRVGRILDKLAQKKQGPLPQLQEEISKLHTKLLLKWDKGLNRCAQHPLNTVTNQQIEKGRGLVREIDMQLLNIGPISIPFDYSLVDKNNDQYYRDLPNPEECKKMASAYYAKKYLEIALETDDRRFDQGGIGWHHEPDVHKHTARFVQKHQPPQGISVEALFEDKDRQVLQAVTLPEELKEFSFTCDASSDLIQKQLENLIDLKNVHRFKSMGVFIEVPPQMLALVFHTSGRISLVNPCGWPATQQSYEANFANARQAANFMSQLISEMRPEKPILLKPYCHYEAIRDADQDLEQHILLNHVVEPKVLINVSPAADSLKRSIDLLSQNTEEGFFQALTFIDDIKSRTAVFLMGDHTERNIFDRCCFHLYHIQDKETPNKVNRNDSNSGLNAFQIEGLSTPEEKLRAVQRTQVELLFNLIDQGGDPDSNRLLFDALEALKLHANDLPKGQGNPAHALFGKLYETCVEARKQNPHLVDPQHEKFQGDFGRNVFRGEVDVEIPFAIKHKALQEVEQAFKATWRI